MVFLKSKNLLELSKRFAVSDADGDVGDHEDNGDVGDGDDGDEGDVGDD